MPAAGIGPLRARRRSRLPPRRGKGAEPVDPTETRHAVPSPSDPRLATVAKWPGGATGAGSAARSAVGRTRTLVEYVPAERLESGRAGEAEVAVAIGTPGREPEEVLVAGSPNHVNRADGRLTASTDRSMMTVPARSPLAEASTGGEAIVQSIALCGRAPDVDAKFGSRY